MRLSLDNTEKALQGRQLDLPKGFTKYALAGWELDKLVNLYNKARSKLAGYGTELYIRLLTFYIF